MNVKNTALRLAGAAMITLAVAPWLGGGSASAEEPPASGDPRATSFNGNVVDCAGAGLAGSVIAVTSTEDATNVNITAIPAGNTVTGVVVKGGDAYNVYLPGALGTLPWLNLHAPLNPNAEPAGISHWFVCATPTPPTTPPTTPATVTTTPATVASTPAAVLPTKASASPEVSVKGTKAVLPHTGSGVKVGLLLATSLALLLGGGAMMMLPGLAPARGKRRRH
jgi:hypothetical protein